ncbi:TPA: ANTAR domain-containing protein [Vibrio vulnificus]|nr:ANTAR domain-containing protein [Vibrio vulnificus]
MSMTKKSYQRTMIVCCDSLTQQAHLAERLAKEYDQVLGCPLGQLEHILRREAESCVVVGWSAPCAEVRLIIEYCRQQKRPVLVLFRQVFSQQFNQLKDCHDCVFLPEENTLPLAPWIDYAAQLRESYLLVEEKVALLNDKLQERKVIEKAKGLLMKFQQVDEETAYQAMRRSAMQTSQPMLQVAKNVIATLTTL